VSFDNHIPVVLSSGGKGGVGKSLVSIGLAGALAKRKKVGLLDMDFRAPNIPYILRLPLETQFDAEFRHIPAQGHLNGHSIPVFSTALVYGDARSILMPGSLIRTAVKDFLYDVVWPDLDVMVVDTDPSAADTLNGLRDVLVNISAFVVTTPEVSSLADSERMLDACNELAIPVTGIVANMVGTACPSCGEPIRCKACGEPIQYGLEQPILDLATRRNVPVAASLPWSPMARLDPIAAVTGPWAKQFDRLASLVLGG
jgi:ATP-binding protein involved in chromosome partitioning